MHVVLGRRFLVVGALLVVAACSGSTAGSGDSRPVSGPVSGAAPEQRLVMLARLNGAASKNARRMETSASFSLTSAALAHLRASPEGNACAAVTVSRAGGDYLGFDKQIAAFRPATGPVAFEKGVAELSPGDYVVKAATSACARPWFVEIWAQVPSLVGLKAGA